MYHYVTFFNVVWTLLNVQKLYFFEIVFKTYLIDLENEFTIPDGNDGRGRE